MSETNKSKPTEEATLFSGDYCLSCTSCMAECPVMKATMDYRGPKLVGPSHGRMHFSQEDTEKSLEFCSNCKSCDRICPSGVSVSTLNMLQRAKYYKTHPHPRRDEILAHSEKMAKLVRSLPLGQFCANMGMKIGSTFGVFKAMGIAEERNMPAYAPQSFLSIFKKIKQTPYEKKIVFYPGCFINDNNPQVGVAFVKVMQQNKYEVLIDKEFNCCGSPMVVTGYLDEAREHAENNVKRILHWKARGIPVLACCTSCSSMLKQEYWELFNEPSMREAATNVYDAFEFLAELAEKGELNKNYGHIAKKLLYHVPCHLKSQGMGTPAADILSEIDGVDLKFADSGCCGMAGNYGFKQDKYDISMKIGAKLFEKIKTVKADDVICDCGTCRLQITHGAKVKACHPIEILAKAYN